MHHKTKSAIIKAIRNGSSAYEVAKKYNVSWTMVKYNTDPQFRKRHIARCRENEIKRKPLIKRILHLLSAN